jgi:PAS domain-containing protein
MICLILCVELHSGSTGSRLTNRNGGPGATSDPTASIRETPLLSRDVSVEDEEFDEGALLLLRELNPHMRMAIRLFNKTGEVQQNLDSVEFALEQFGIGVFVLDNNGAVIFANATARRHLECREGLAIEGGRIKATSGRDHALLNACMQKAVLAGECPGITDRSIGANHGNK